MHFDLGKRTFETLEELGKTVVELGTLDKEAFELEYLFDVSDHECLITMYYKPDITLRKIIKFGMKEFQCSYLDTEVPQRGKEEIVRFFRSTVRMIHDQLELKVE
jgi:hypothetical protein